MGVNEGFAIAARAQLSNISAFTDTMTKINTTSGSPTPRCRRWSTSARRCRTPPNSAIAGAEQRRADHRAADRSRAILVDARHPEHAGRRPLCFSGSAIYTPPVAASDLILNGNGAQAGLKQVIAERNQADLGTAASAVSHFGSPTATSVSVAEDASPSVFG